MQRKGEASTEESSERELGKAEEGTGKVVSHYTGKINQEHFQNPKVK